MTTLPRFTRPLLSACVLLLGLAVGDARAGGDCCDTCDGAADCNGHKCCKLKRLLCWWHKDGCGCDNCTCGDNCRCGEDWDDDCEGGCRGRSCLSRLCGCGGHGHGGSWGYGPYASPVDARNAWVRCKFGYFIPTGGNGQGVPLAGHYHLGYPLNPDYFDPRDGRVYAAQGYGAPMGVPLAPNVEYTFNYGWGVPSSRLTPVSRHVPPSPGGIYPVGYFGPYNPNAPSGPFGGQ